MDKEVPEDFLRGVESIRKSFALMQKIKKGAEGEGDISLSWKECQTLIWILTILKERKSDG